MDLVAYTNNDGTFEWKIDNTNIIVYTYCLSVNNFIGSNPQLFEVYGIAGCTAADIAASGILTGNSMPGLTATTFLEAAAQAQSYGPNYGITALDDVHNFNVHNTETNGDISWDSQPYNNFYYLKPINENGSGQPQGLVTPEPTTMAVSGIGAISFFRRRKKV